MRAHVSVRAHVFVCLYVYVCVYVRVFGEWWRLCVCVCVCVCASDDNNISTLLLVLLVALLLSVKGVLWDGAPLDDRDTHGDMDSNFTVKGASNAGARGGGIDDDGDGVMQVL